jgi:hypothetical protein
LLALFAMLSPRLAIGFVFLFTDRMGIAFQHFWMGLVGFIFLPWTTLAWTLCYQRVNGVSGFGWILVVTAFLVDIASLGGTSQARRRQRTPA